MEKPEMEGEKKEEEAKPDMEAAEWAA
jgi:hypothetical protein